MKEHAVNPKDTQLTKSPLPSKVLLDAPMRTLNLKEIKQVAGGPGGFPLLSPKKP
jgi:hypothetical protein